MRILMAEAGDAQADRLRLLLEKHGFGVDLVHDRADMPDHGITGSYDLILVAEDETVLPELRALREAGCGTPVLVLTENGAPAYRADCLDAGADDCMSRPADNVELLARIRALARRGGRSLQSSVLVCGDLMLRRERMELCCGAAKVGLASKEFLMMEHLMEGGGQVCSRQSLYERGWGLLSEMEYNGVEVYVSFLRRKLAKLNTKVRICAVRGTGYRLEWPE